MKLFEKYLLPWSIENISPDWNGSGGYIIRAADGTIVIHGGTYTGDGDLECNFTYLQAKELVSIVNAQHRVQADGAKALPHEHNFENSLYCSVCGQAQF